MTVAPPDVAADALDPGSAPQVWSGAISWEREGDWWRPWRLDPVRAELAFAPELILRARMAAGIRLRLVTDATALHATLDVDEPIDCPIDLVVDGRLAERRALGVGRQELVWTLPGASSRVELWLPQAGPVGVVAAAVTGGSTTRSSTHGGVRWLCYGSSITQCSAAAGPAETWPALIARERDWDLTCLGFGGQCHLDPVVAGTIADREADLISLCLGINVHGGGSFSERTWTGQVVAFVQQVRAAHPGVPILVQSPIACPDREDAPSPSGITLRGLRDGVHTAVAALAADDPLLVGLDGLTVLAPDEAWRMPDGLHPDAEGYRLMATRIGPALDAVLAVGRG